ncbi:hypothetical protein ACG7TL_008443 [Trametes sanguinea]
MRFCVRIIGLPGREPSHQASNATQNEPEDLKLRLRAKDDGVLIVVPFRDRLPVPTLLHLDSSGRSLIHMIRRSTSEAPLESRSKERLRSIQGLTVHPRYPSALVLLLRVLNTPATASLPVHLPAAPGSIHRPISQRNAVPRALQREHIIQPAQPASPIRRPPFRALPLPPPPPSPPLSG